MQKTSEFESREGLKHPEKALSDAAIRGRLAPGRYTDGNCLHLVVDPSGTKHWVLRVVVHGIRRDIGLGGLKVVSLAAAREEARRLRKIAREGGDPLAERRKAHRQIPTFETGAREYHREKSKGFKNPVHAAQWLTSLEAHCFSKIGSRRIDTIQPDDVLTVLAPIWMETPETARRVRQRIRAVMDWAKAKEYFAGDNPAANIGKLLPTHANKKKHFRALHHSKLPAFIKALHQCDSGLSVVLAFEWLILTVTRTSETLNARWTEINFDQKCWTIPAERMKAGEEHTIPLSPRCLQILEEAKALGDSKSEFIFPGRSHKEPLSNMVFLMTLRRMNRNDITAHGMRSTFRDWAEERGGFSRNAIERSLAHTVRDQVEGAYLRTTLFDQRVTLMNAWCEYATS